MKNAIPKNDKKRRKQLTEDIAKLEAELTQKHENELKLLQNSPSVSYIVLLDIKTPYLETIKYIHVIAAHLYSYLGLF